MEGFSKIPFAELGTMLGFVIFSVERWSKAGHVKAFIDTAAWAQGRLRVLFLRMRKATTLGIASHWLSTHLRYDGDYGMGLCRANTVIRSSLHAERI